VVAAERGGEGVGGGIAGARADLRQGQLAGQTEGMTNSSPNVLVLGGTGKTSSRLAASLADICLGVCTVAPGPDQPLPLLAGHRARRCRARSVSALA
jgi:hypothetical protein